MSEQRVHIPVALLWEHSRDSTVLESGGLDHLESCEECIAILVLSKTSDSFEHLKSMLTKYSITRE